MNIVELAERLGLKPQRAGKTFRVFCFFHTDTTTPNLTLYPETNRFYCFACREAGDIVKFYAGYRKIPIEQAKIELQGEIPAFINGNNYKERLEKLSQYSEIYRVFINYLQEQNKKKPDQEALNYLHNRRLLEDETIKEFKISIQPEGKREYQKLKDFLMGQFSIEELRGAGIIQKHNKQLTFLRHRIIYPLELFIMYKLSIR